jgi:hypothetical protein
MTQPRSDAREQAWITYAEPHPRWSLIELEARSSAFDTGWDAREQQLPDANQIAAALYEFWYPTTRTRWDKYATVRDFWLSAAEHVLTTMKGDK